MNRLRNRDTGPFLPGFSLHRPNSAPQVRKSYDLALPLPRVDFRKSDRFLGCRTPRPAAGAYPAAGRSPAPGISAERWRPPRRLADGRRVPVDFPGPAGWPSPCPASTMASGIAAAPSPRPPSLQVNKCLIGSRRAPALRPPPPDRSTQSDVRRMLASQRSPPRSAPQGSIRLAVVPRRGGGISAGRRPDPRP
jgi:hypothetical protein